MGTFLVICGLGLALFALGGLEEARARRHRTSSKPAGRPAGPMIRTDRPDRTQP